jgi:hypothetical protein
MPISQDLGVLTLALPLSMTIQPLWKDKKSMIALCHGFGKEQHPPVLLTRRGRRHPKDLYMRSISFNIGRGPTSASTLLIS